MRDPSGLQVIEALCPQVSRYAMATHDLPERLKDIVRIGRQLGRSYWTMREIMERDAILNTQLIEPFDIELAYKKCHEGADRPSELLLLGDVTLPSGQVLIAGAYVLDQETKEYTCYKHYSPEYEAVVRRMRKAGALGVFPETMP